MTDFVELPLRFGYQVVARVGREEPRHHGVSEALSARVAVLAPGDLVPVARLSRPADGEGGPTVVDYALAEGVLLRTCLAPSGKPLLAADLASLPATDHEGWPDYPMGFVLVGNSVREPVASLHDARAQDHAGRVVGRGPLRGTRFEEAAAARLDAERVAAGLRVVDGVLWRPCPPPAWGIVPDAGRSLDRTAAVAVVPDMDVPALALRDPHWKPRNGSAPVALVPPDVDAHVLRASFDAVEGVIETSGSLPRADLAQDSAYLLARRLAHDGAARTWVHMDFEHRLDLATLEAVIARFRGLSPRAGAAVDEVRAAASDLVAGRSATRRESGAAAWLAADAISVGLADDLEAEAAVLSM